MSELTLANVRIGVPESRELDVFAGLLERRGAEVVRCPLLTIRDAPDPAPVLQWIEAFCGGSCQDLILLTGEGLRRLLSCIDQHRPELKAAFVDRLGQVRKITRGPKPARALRELGLKPDIAAAIATTQGVMETLRAEVLAGRTVGVQLYGTEPNLPLVEFLREHGAFVSTVAPYVYADRADDDAVKEFIVKMQHGSLDVVAFTSMAQVERLFAVAADDEVRAALSKTRVAAVGPVVADALRAHAVTVEFMPEESFFMKPLVAEIEARYRRQIR